MDGNEKLSIRQNGSSRTCTFARNAAQQSSATDKDAPINVSNPRKIGSMYIIIRSMKEVKLNIF